MDQGKQRGRSRKKKQNRFLTSLLRGNHRRLSALLCATMVLNGTASAFPVMAAEKEPETIALTSSDLWDALDAAIEDGTVEAPDFGDSYAELFGDDVYRLSVSPVIADDDLNVDVYANVASESLDAEEEYSKDSVDFVFLVSNGNESDGKKVQIAIDGKKSVEVTVPASSDTETDVLLEDPAESKAESPTEPEAESPTEPESKPATEEESSAEESQPEENQPTDAGEDESGTGETKPEEPSTETPADPSEPDGTDDDETGDPGTDDETPGEDSQKPEETPGTGETAGENSGETETGDNGGDETVSGGSDEEKPEDSETETGETPEEDSQQPGGEDLDNSSESAEETGGQTSADDLEVTEGDAPEADNSDSGSSEGTGDESDSSESAIAALSVSLHDAPYLAVGGTDPLASGSVIEEDENVLAGQWIEDAALLNGKAVVAYVISGGELNDKEKPVVDPIKPEIPDWEISKSKTATELNENLESTVTLGLPSAEKAIDTDIVFVVDKSSSAEDAIASLKNMVDDLAAETADLEASAIKVGVVLFDGRVGSPTNGLIPLQGNEAIIKEALDEKYGSGTNVQGGILKGMQILEEDTSVPDENKYLILITDGISHIWNKNDDPDGQQMTSYVEVAPDNIHSVWAGADSYYYFRDENGWTFDELMSLNVEDMNGWNNDVPYTPDSSTILLENWDGPYVALEDWTDSIITLEKGIYKAAQAYIEASTKYKTISVYWESSGYSLASQFMEGIGATRIEKGDTVQIASVFAEIEDDILYLLDAGSRVVDEIGQGTTNLGDPYDFTFVNDVDRVELTVKGAVLDKELIEQDADGAYTSYGFGKRGEGGYRFVVTYYPNGTEERDGEHFVWEIHEAISNFAPVQFRYAVKLTQVPTTEGTHGQNDESGAHEYPGLLTNLEATLYPVDSNGEQYEPETFPKPTVSYTVGGSSEVPADWEVSKSKTATELNENLESTVTLGLPSAEKAIDTDIVFVVDKSSSAKNAIASLKSMVDDLSAETADLEASVIKVGVVLFDGKVGSPTDGLIPLRGNEDTIKAALDQEKYGDGTNVQGGILKGMQILENDSSVPDENKYLILITDGISHIWNENDDPDGRQMTSWVETVTDYHWVWANPNSYLYFRDGKSWTFDELMTLNVESMNGWNNDLPYTGETTCRLEDWDGGPYVELKDQDTSINTLEKGVYKAAQAYREASTRYNTISVYWETSGYSIATQFMEGIGAIKIDKGDTVQIASVFAEIEDDILYLLDAGSRVVDEIGQGTTNLGDPYDFTFVNDVNRMELTVKGVALDKELISQDADGAYTSYGFGKRGEGDYRFVVTYYPNGTEETDGEHFVWEIHEAISNFAPVQFRYAVKLTQVPTAEGTHGQNDENGAHGYPGLLTNLEATLYPVDSDGTTYPSETFPKPTVSYTVDKGGETPDPKPDPDEEQFTITVNYYRKSDNAVLRDAQVITLDANAAYNVRDLVNAAISGYRWDSYSVPEGQTGDLTGTLTGDLVFNVYYVASSTSPGGSGGSSGGGGGSRNPYNPGGGPGVTIEEDAVPLAPLPENNETVAINEDNVPLSPLPKTGQEKNAGAWLAMLSGLVTAAYVLLGGKKEREAK